MEGNLSINELADRLQLLLELTEREHRIYEDTYFRNDLPKFSGRSPVLRLRKRTLGKHDLIWTEDQNFFHKIGQLQTLQIVYTRAKEEFENPFEQFRFFVTKKEKFYHFINYTMPKGIKDIRSRNAYQIIAPAYPLKDVFFQRLMMRDNEERVLVAIDKPQNNSSYLIIELKVYHHLDFLIRAMRLVMKEFPAIQTTMRKAELGFFG